MKMKARAMIAPRIDAARFARHKDPIMFSPADPLPVHIDLLATARGKRFGTVLADPPWQFQARTGKVAPEQNGIVAPAKAGA
jgi:hypothetical protein